MHPSRKPSIILIFLIALCGLFVYSYTTRLSEKTYVDAAIVAMQARIQSAKVEQQELLEQRELLDQPDYLDRVARTKFNYALPGDRVLVIIDEAEEGTAANNAPLTANAASNPIDFRNFPVWQQWVVFFTSDSFVLSLQ